MLYLGDTSLTTAACYLAGVLHRAGYKFEYRPSDYSLTVADLSAADDLLILSDYPSSRISGELQRQIIERQRDGLSLLMIGGWESFHGCDGHWHETLLGAILPVEISSSDDRQNCDGPAFVHCQIDHPITAGLPWTTQPPLIGGFNHVLAKPHAEVLLSVERQRATRTAVGYQLTPLDSQPLLVVESTANSRMACLLTDLAPHWVGPLVDWGPSRIKAQAPGAEAIEVGNHYVQFIEQLIHWLLDR